VAADGRRFVLLRFKDENSDHETVALFVKRFWGSGAPRSRPTALLRGRLFTVRNPAPGTTAYRLR
jgi:hypothetical protein